MPLDLPTTGVRSYDYDRGTHLHNGVDLYAAEGTPVYAAAGGIVRHATFEWHQGFTGYGRVVSIDADDGTHQLYAHLLEPLVSPGEHVTQGQLIARSGRTGYSKDDHASLIDHPHLHFEVAPAHYPMAQEDPRLDPVEWLQRGHMHPIARVVVNPPAASSSSAEKGTGPAAPPFEPPQPASPPSSPGSESRPFRSYSLERLADEVHAAATRLQELAQELEARSVSA